jgi:hypothetical protein
MAGTTDRSSGERIMTPPLPQADRPHPDTPLAMVAAAAGSSPAVEQDSFVINLCSSTTPMALTQPQLAQLKSYKFFISRRLEDGRERFRLHMGYFDSLLQAEDLLPLVRDIYPGAWAGEAPGKRLRARAAAPAPVPPAKPAKVGTPPVLKPVATPDASILAHAPTLSPVVADDSGETRRMPELKLELVPDPVAPVAAATPPALPVIEIEIESKPPEPAPAAAPIAAAPVAVAPVAAVTAAAPMRPSPRPAPPRPVAAKRDVAQPLEQRSNVREVMKSLEESALPRAALSPAPASAPAPVARQPGVLPESQVMRLLEEKRGDPLNTTSTPAAFAVQLQWSVQPIDLARVPPLAIFVAYMLYTVEGSREGRRWYGLRLGFFSDANAAKQVAQYVRSEFSSVAVVPVSLKERDGASGAQGGAKSATESAAANVTPAAARAAGPTERLPDQSAEFKLLDDTAETPKLPAAAAAAAAAAAKAPIAKPQPAAAPAKSPIRGGPRTVKGRGNRVHAREKRAPQTLEETLEILGADELQMEGAKRQLVSEGPIRHLDVKVQKNSALSRLLDRLAERSR